MISLSPLPTAHPKIFQHQPVRSSTKSYLRFNLAMGRSRGFGSIPCNSCALFKLGFPLATAFVCLNLAAKNNSRTHYAKGTPSKRKHAFSSPTACKRTVSGSLSLPSPGFFSPFPHGTCSLSVIEDYLALADGPAGFTQDTWVPCYSGSALGFLRISLTGLSPSLDTPSRALSYPPKYLCCAPHNPYESHLSWFRLLRVRSPLLTESLICFLFLQVLRCFNSLRSPHKAMNSPYVDPLTWAGFPHSDTPGSKLHWQLPEAYRSLARPSSPLDTKASTVRPYLLNTLHITYITLNFTLRVYFIVKELP